MHQRIDTVMQDPSISSFKTFSELLYFHGVIVHPHGKNVSYAFLDANKQAYVWKDGLCQRIDTVMQDPSISSFKTFSELLYFHGVIVHPHGKNVSYAFLDANNKQRRARGIILGHDYEKEVLEHQLEQRVQLSIINKNGDCNNFAIELFNSLIVA